MFIVICYSIHEKKIASVDSKKTYEEANKFLEEDAKNTYEEEVENGENLFEMTVVRVIENSFSYNIHIKNCDNENNLPLQMEVDKNIKKVKVGQTIKVKFEQNSVFDF